MPAAAASDLNAARPLRALTTAPTDRAAPASVTVTVRIDVPGGQLPPAVLGLLESVRALAGPAAATGAGPMAVTVDGPAAPVIRAATGAGPAAPAHGWSAQTSQTSQISPTGAWPAARSADGTVGDGRSADGTVADGDPTDGIVTGGRTPDPGDGWAARPRPRLLRTGAQTGPAAPSLRIYSASRMVVRAGVPIRLTRREYDLLAFLCEYPRRVFTRRQLMRQVWGHEMVGGERTVDVHVRRLRVKLGEPGPLIATVRGVGYRLDDATQVAIVADAQ